MKLRFQTKAEDNGVFPKWSRTFIKFRESDKSLKHEFKDPVSHVYIAGAVVASWSLTQKVAGLSPFTVMTNTFVTQFAEFSETFRKNSIHAICF